MLLLRVCWRRRLSVVRSRQPCHFHVAPSSRHILSFQDVEYYSSTPFREQWCHPLKLLIPEGGEGLFLWMNPTSEFSPSSVLWFHCYCRAVRYHSPNVVHPLTLLPQHPLILPISGWHPVLSDWRWPRVDFCCSPIDSANFSNGFTCRRSLLIDVC